MVKRLGSLSPRRSAPCPAMGLLATTLTLLASKYETWCMTRSRRSRASSRGFGAYRGRISGRRSSGALCITVSRRLSGWANSTAGVRAALSLTPLPAVPTSSGTARLPRQFETTLLPSFRVLPTGVLISLGSTSGFFVRRSRPSINCCGTSSAWRRWAPWSMAVASFLALHFSATMNVVAALPKMMLLTLRISPVLSIFATPQRCFPLIWNFCRWKPVTVTLFYVSVLHALS